MSLLVAWLLVGGALIVPTFLFHYSGIRDLRFFRSNPDRLLGTSMALTFAAIAGGAMLLAAPIVALLSLL